VGYLPSEFSTEASLRLPAGRQFACRRHAVFGALARSAASGTLVPDQRSGARATCVRLPCSALVSGMAVRRGPRPVVTRMAKAADYADMAYCAAPLSELRLVRAL
jgi:hypothetical protein